MVGAALFALGWTSSFRLSTAKADGFSDDASAVEQVVYSDGQNGGKLKWVSHRPQSVQAEGAVTAAQYSQPARPARRPVRTAQNTDAPKSDAFSDPFGDTKPKTPPAPLEEIEEPAPSEAQPDFNAGTPSELEKPYVLPEELAPRKSSDSGQPSAHQPLLEREFAAKQHEFKEGCPSPKDLKPINELTTNIRPKEGELPHDCPLGHAVFQPRSFAPTTFTWTASGLCHKPLYFEDVQLERYGHMAGPWLQPFASAANFFATFPILPYKMGLEPPGECLYTLGYYRPGNCAPYLFDPIPLSVRAALFEAGAWVGGACVIP